MKEISPNQSNGGIQGCQMCRTTRAEPWCAESILKSQIRKLKETDSRLRENCPNSRSKTRNAADIKHEVEVGRYLASGRNKEMLNNTNETHSSFLPILLGGYFA
jgi:hypothetical protein